jgi:hypothetical protein
MTEFRRVKSKKDIAEVARLAHEIWNEHYVSIIGQAQVDYMVKNFQSASAIAVQIAGGYEYYLILHDGAGLYTECGLSGSYMHAARVSDLKMPRCRVQKASMISIS